ncbi:hypothetical protein [Stenotrophomonas sp. B2]|uniref:hypothetical protein n=1 Tax=Stenotrophomonas sp. B2 TaxID=1537778 RepID=UPI0018744587|nr:hypothetical protein [Stenotrophomonas sp. B2]MBE5272206.1 hypothetical protein [Stenotrophomonas sp. B2]
MIAPIKDALRGVAPRSPVVNAITAQKMAISIGGCLSAGKFVKDILIDDERRPKNSRLSNFLALNFL